jgi:hypothetical protein
LLAKEGKKIGRKERRVGMEQPGRLQTEMKELEDL